VRDDWLLSHFVEVMSSQMDVPEEPSMKFSAYDQESMLNPPTFNKRPRKEM
jgi:hypothetical protein